MTFQDRVLSMLTSLESRVEVLTKHEEKLRQEVAIYKTALSAQVMATHEAPRVEVPKPHTFSGQQDAMAVAESLMDYKESMSSNDEGRKDEECRREGGLSACAQRHALSKWCRVIEIASEVSRLVMSLGR